MNLTFKEYLQEVTVNMDDDPVESKKQAMQASRAGGVRTAAAEKAKVKAEQDAAKAAGGEKDPDVKRQRQLRQQLASTEQRIEMKKRTQEQNV